MKKLLFLPLVFVGCSLTTTTQKVKNFATCYINKIPAPTWVCYQSSFLSIGKVHTDSFTKLKQEEAYSLGVSEFVAKLQSKTKLFLRKLNIDDKEILKEVKEFVILNAIEGDSWFDKKSKMLYVKVEVSKDEFKKFLYSKLKTKVKKSTFLMMFDETF